MAQDVWEAFRRTSEAIAFRRAQKHLLQRRHPHWIAPLQPPARTGIDSHVARLAAFLVSLICPESNVHVFVCLFLSFTPPSTGYCVSGVLAPPSARRPDLRFALSEWIRKQFLHGCYI